MAETQFPWDQTRNSLNISHLRFTFETSRLVIKYMCINFDSLGFPKQNILQH